MSETTGQFWDGIADEWRQRRTPHPERSARLARFLGCDPGSMILDAGCGAGAISVPLAAQGYRIRGVDASERMIANAREVTLAYGLSDEQARFAVGDIEQLAFTDATFDAIICSAVIDFTPRPGSALSEFQRVLRPGARLLISTLGAYSPIKHDWWRRFLPDNDASRIRNYLLPWEMETLLTTLGWQILEQWPVFGPALDGSTTEYTEAVSEQLADRVLQQTIATTWWFVTERPA